VYPCIYGIGGVKEYPVANLQKDSLINIWNNSPKLDIFRGKLKIQDLPVCRSCKFQIKCNLKHCRLRSIYEGREFTDPTSFCTRMIAEDIKTI
jgi:radical SAM protein with 4Fe4S-binding SPASM domain